MVFLWPEKFSPFCYACLDGWLDGWLADWRTSFYAVVYNFSFYLQSAEHEPHFSQSNAIKIIHVLVRIGCFFSMQPSIHLAKVVTQSERNVKRKWGKLSIFHVANCDSLQFTKLKVDTGKRGKWTRYRDDGKVTQKQKEQFKMSLWKDETTMAYPNQMRRCRVWDFCWYFESS